MLGDRVRWGLGWVVTACVTAWPCVALAYQAAQRFDRVAGQVAGQAIVIEAGAQLPDQRQPGQLADLFWQAVARVIVEQEIECRQITPDAEQVEQRAQQRWQPRLAQMGDAQERQAFFQGVRRLNRTISETLQIWEGDPAAGDREAQSRLLPLGVGRDHWAWIKRNYHRQDVAASIRSGMTYGERTMLDEERLHARQRIVWSMLNQQMAQGDPLDEAPARRYLQLLTLARQGRLTVQQRVVGVYASGQVRPPEHRPHGLPGQDRQGVSRINRWAFMSRDGQADDPLPDDAVAQLASLALVMETIEAGQWTPPRLSVEISLSMTVSQYQLFWQGAAPEPTGSLSEKERLSLAAEHGRLTLDRWLLDQLRSQVKLDPASQWAMGLISKPGPTASKP